MPRLICLAIVGVLCPVSAGRSDDASPGEGFQPLFDGKTLTGWKVLNGKISVWGAADGVLFVNGKHGGWLMTEKEYSDFEIRLDFKMPPQGNSGVALRAPMRGDPAYQGMEIQLLDDPWYKKNYIPRIRPTQLTGSIYDVVPPSQDVLKPTGDWNTIDITAKGRHVTVVLNGTQIVNANLDDYKDRIEAHRGRNAHPGLARTSGHLGLQSHDGRVEFRNIYVKPL